MSRTSDERGQSFESACQKLISIAHYLGIMGRDGKEDITVIKVDELPDFLVGLSEELVRIGAVVQLQEVCRAPEKL